MRISQKTEWLIVVALILYTAFTPGFQPVRQFLSTGVGKAIGLAAIVGVWTYVSPLIAVLLVIDFVRCATLREYMTDGSGSTTTTTAPPPNTYCPTDYKYENGQCKGSSGQSIPATVCQAGQTWDGNKCVGSTTPPPTVTPPPSTSSTTTKQPFTNMTPAPVVGGVQPDIKEKFSGLEFSPF